MTTRPYRFGILALVALAAIVTAWMAFGRQGGGTASTARVSTPPEAGERAGAMPAVGAGSHAMQDGTLANEAYLQELMRRYEFEMQLDKRGALLAVLQANPNEAVKQFALELAASGDAAKRLEGLELLKAFPLDDADVRGFLVGQINQEQDPATLTRLVDMLAPAMVATEDAAPLVAQLERLREHPDPEVRAASVLQSSQWDKGGDLENTLHHAMLDPDARVRQAAIGGITAERVHSDRLKDILLAIAYDPQTSGEERNRAIFALEGFALNRSELEIYRQAAQLGEAGEGPGHHGH